MNVDDLRKLCDAAIADHEQATPGPWLWWTSNSFRRLSSPNGDGDVLYGYRNPRDGVVDIVGSDADKNLIANMRDREPVLAIMLRDLLQALAPYLERNQLSADGFIEILEMNRRLRASLHEACNLAETVLLRADRKILPSTNATLAAWRQEAAK